MNVSVHPHKWHEPAHRWPHVSARPHLQDTNNNLLSRCAVHHAALQGYDVLEDMMGTKTAAANFVTTLAQKKPKTHLPWLMARLVEVMNAHDAAVKAAAAGGPPVSMELARQMDGAMLAIGSLSSTLKARVSGCGMI